MLRNGIFIFTFVMRGFTYGNNSFVKSQSLTGGWW